MTEGLTYRDAMEELQGILAALEADDVDVDALSASVRRAVELIDFCRSRIAATEIEIEQVLSDLGGNEDGGERSR